MAFSGPQYVLLSVGEYLTLTIWIPKSDIQMLDLLPVVKWQSEKRIEKVSLGSKMPGSLMGLPRPETTIWTPDTHTVWYSDSNGIEFIVAFKYHSCDYSFQ